MAPWTAPGAPAAPGLQWYTPPTALTQEKIRHYNGTLAFAPVNYRVDTRLLTLVENVCVLQSSHRDSHTQVLRVISSQDQR